VRKQFHVTLDLETVILTLTVSLGCSVVRETATVSFSDSLVF